MAWRSGEVGDVEGREDIRGRREDVGGYGGT